MKPRARREEKIPCHFSFCNGIICGPHPGSFAVQFGDHFWSGDHLRGCTLLFDLHLGHQQTLLFTMHGLE